MKALVRRIAGLEDKAKPIDAVQQFNWSMIDPAELQWLHSQFAITLQADGNHDFQELRCDELRRMEWLMERCSPDGIVGHDIDCRCYYCQPLRSKSWRLNECSDGTAPSF